MKERHIRTWYAEHTYTFTATLSLEEAKAAHTSEDMALCSTITNNSAQMKAPKAILTRYNNENYCAACSDAKPKEYNISEE